MKKELLTYKDPKSPISEIFRTLRTNIQFMNTDKKLKTILVTSTFPEEGKSWVTSNLAVTFAQAGKKVILIDADMRKGRQYNIFGALPKPGLSNYLSSMDSENMEVSDVNIINYIQETEVENLSVIVAGNVPPNPSELLVSSRMRELLKNLKEMCDIIIIDGTPCDLVTDSIILSRYVDSTIVVTVPKKTKKDNLTRIVKNIQNVGGKIAGVVVNKVDIPAKKYNETYYYGSISGNNLNTTTKNNRKNELMIESFIKNDINNIKEEEDIKTETEIETEQEQEQEQAQEQKYKQEENVEIREDNPEQMSIENAQTDKGMTEEKAEAIMNLVNSYVEEEKQKVNQEPSQKNKNKSKNKKKKRRK